MRLFAAVLPPERVVAELGRAVDRTAAATGRGALRWTGRDGWHLTLAFLGEVDDLLLPELARRLERAAYRTEPFSLRLHGSGHFGESVLWAGVAGALDDLRLLAERTDAAARRAGVPMEEHRRYQPHLTLAHGGGCGAGTDLRPYVDGLAGFEGSPWEVTGLVLVRSFPRGSLPRYETVTRSPLGAAGGAGEGGSAGPALGSPPAGAGTAER